MARYQFFSLTETQSSTMQKCLTVVQIFSFQGNFFFFFFLVVFKGIWGNVANQ